MTGPPASRPQGPGLTLEGVLPALGQLGERVVEPLQLVLAHRVLVADGLQRRRVVHVLLQLVYVHLADRGRRSQWGRQTSVATRELQ